MGVIGGDGPPAVSPEAPCKPIPVYENGGQVGQTCLDEADPTLYEIELGDRWAPRIFSETPDHPQPYREVFIALANGRLREGKGAATAQRDRYFELFGIFPTFSVEVIIDVPLGGFVKRKDDGAIDFVSPAPCPFNYGSVPDTRSGYGDRLDAVVLGPRLPRGARVRVNVVARVRFTDAGQDYPKLICPGPSAGPSGPRESHHFLRALRAGQSAAEPRARQGRPHALRPPRGGESFDERIRPERAVLIGLNRSNTTTRRLRSRRGHPAPAPDRSRRSDEQAVVGDRYRT
jgi:hypothetical protein